MFNFPGLSPVENPFTPPLRYFSDLRERRQEVGRGVGVAQVSILQTFYEQLLHRHITYFAKNYTAKL